jgi:hypothetical protein
MGAIVASRRLADRFTPEPPANVAREADESVELDQPGALVGRGTRFCHSSTLARV